MVILHFLNDVLKHGSYTGFPTIGLETQTMENEHLREAFGTLAVISLLCIIRLTCRRWKWNCRSSVSIRLPSRILRMVLQVGS